MAQISLKINGRQHNVDVDPDCPLLYVLRDTLSLNNPRFGCGLGQCGACTVLVDNRAVRSCTLPASRAVGREIVTIEGLATAGRPHPVQRAFIEEQAFQCGYCLNGWVLTAKALLDTNPKASDADVRRACESLICRCGSHTRIFAAVQRAQKTMSNTAVKA
jgi:nicotinate dehydrogenase subunit A